ncbi:MAG TPA: hypothetical protein PKY97_06710, partial [Saprospiraceae bacterium]|nr:hypothetical protein [Saprospiraceae bacterium]
PISNVWQRYGVAYAPSCFHRHRTFVLPDAICVVHFVHCICLRSDLRLENTMAFTPIGIAAINR